ncbi:MAG: DUF342 domain-containing protein [Nitrospirae bacterium]|nr:DUF342 domain-containing protein [Nitrospirota bacterium]
MVVGEDLFDEKIGPGIPIVCRGVVVTKDIIQSLMDRELGWVCVEVPADYHGAPGETLELIRVKKNIFFKGKVSVLCDIPQNITIEAGESIMVRGNVQGGSRLTSRTGGVRIAGTVQGTVQKMVRIDSLQHITIEKEIEGADIKASGSVRVAGDIIDSSIVAKGDIVGEGSIIRSQLYSQSKIRLGECGQSPCLLVVKPLECIELSQELLKIDARVQELRREMETIQNNVDLVRRLGQEIERLAEEKKIEFARAIARFKKIEGEIGAALSRKTTLKEELAGHTATKRIFVAGDIHPQTKVTIESCMYTMTRKEQGLAFFVKDGKMAATPFTADFGK